MPKAPHEDSIEHAVARLLAEPEDSATPEVEPDAQPEAPDEAVSQVEDEEYEETETDEITEEDYESEEAVDESESEEETEDEDTENEGEEPEVYTVKIDGEEYEVNLDELTSGYQRQKDYTKKTQALAEERKQLEAKLAEASQVQEDFKSKAVLANELLNRDLAKYASVDWETLKRDNPTEFLTKQIEVQDIKKAQQELQEAYRKSMEETARAQQEAFQAKLAEEQPKVLAAFPEWKDKEKGSEHWNKIMDYGRSVGFDDDTLSRFVTARDLTVLDKARKYDEIQKTKKGITKKVKPTIKKVVKTKGVAPKSTGVTKKLAERKDTLRASGSIQDAAALLMERRLAGQKRFRK